MEKREAVSVERNEGGDEGIETGGGGEAVGAEERDEDGSRDRRAGGRCRERKMEKISNSVLAVRRESKPAEEGRRSMQRTEQRDQGRWRCRERGSWRKSLQVGAGGEDGVKTGGGGGRCRGGAWRAEAVDG
ncbi:hypothetical protein Scep_023839 [Stephania cephalantha]|uniref:Uncharacterized protein n=1 Tax=Stephania cephalantha TaxID=152367 RepID=A0AAP0HXT6_9MAGN